MSSEEQTVIIQRRGIYATRDIKPGEIIDRDMIDLLRPAVGLKPSDMGEIISKKSSRNGIKAGEPIKQIDLE